MTEEEFYKILIIIKSGESPLTIAHYIVVTIILFPHLAVIKIKFPKKTGIQGDAVPLAVSKGGAFGGVWGNAPTV